MKILAFLLATLLECGVSPLDGSRAGDIGTPRRRIPALHRRGLSSLSLVTEVAEFFVTRSTGKNISLGDQAKSSLTRQYRILGLWTCHFDDEILTSQVPLCTPQRLSRMSMPFWDHPSHVSRQRRLSNGSTVSDEARMSKRSLAMLVGSAPILRVKFSRGRWGCGDFSRQGPSRGVAGPGITSSEPTRRGMRRSPVE